jgi:hypothetical protein
MHTWSAADSNIPGYLMQCQWDGIAGLTLKTLSPNWNHEDQVVTEYRTMPNQNKWHVVMFWGTGPGSGSCDLSFSYPSNLVLVLAEVPA